MRIYVLLALFVLAGLALTGCAPPRKQAETAVKSALKDPESARFGEAMKVRGDGAAFVACGSVNAKNSFGGYTGDTQFMIWNNFVYFSSDDAHGVSSCCDFVYAAGESGSTKLSQEASLACQSIGPGAPVSEQ